jgi:hypothetical protein
MATRGFGLLVLVLSGLVLAYVSTGLLADAPVLPILAVPAALGAAALGFLMLSGKA